MRTVYAAFVAITLAVTLAGCNDDHHRSGDSGKASASAVAATPTLGPIYNAPVSAYRAGDFNPDAEDNEAARIDTGSLDTGASGTVSLGDIAAADFPLLLVTELDAQSSYYDESTLTEIAIPDDLQGTMLHALVPAPSAGSPVAITPFTEIAYRAAVAQDLLPISADAAARLNNIVRDALPGSLENLLTAPTVFDAGTTTGSLAAHVAGRHALLLAALAVLGEGRDAPALRVLADLLADLADDSQLNASDTVNETYGQDLAERYQAAIVAIANAYGSAALQAEAADYAALKTQFDFSGVDNDSGGGSGGIGGEAGNADPSSTDLSSRMGATGIVDCKTRTFTTSVMAVSGIGGKAQIIVLGDLPLKAWEFVIPPQTGSYDCETIDGALITYRYGNPLTGEPIVMYLASDAVSCSIKAYRDGQDFVGTFTATLIGAGSATHAVTSGGFRVILPANIAAEEGAEEVDEGSPNGGVSGGGIGGTIDGNNENVTEGVLVEEGSGLIGITASQADPQRNWGLRFPAKVGSYACGPTPSTFIQFGRNFLADDSLSAQALGSGAGSCTIVVTSLTAETVEGTFSGVLVDAQDNEYPVTNGAFVADRL